ncbi:hypothetical protein [Actinomadura sp. WMMB 499]|uniref:hypothetical protein n=1 Tax=Actinomadura sp. WMMB 499 TaxID=1219491 RepID=UPI0012471F1A|nr:hypothetical protein [Actinomadura sp. WMMB 499]QFG26631.1 hypothetical protein F7P10_41335 [Actinomadura sp. WMMB 499]
MRALALHARRLAGTPALSEILEALSARGRYERRTALHMAMSARDLPFVERVLAGADLELRRAALRAVRTLPVSDAAAAAVLDDAPADLRRAFYRTLRHAGRPALADRLLPDVRARWGDREAAALLPACSGEAVARWLPDLDHAVTAWRALAERHPGPFLALAHERGTGWGWLRRRTPGVSALARRDPAGLLELLEREDVAESLWRRLPIPVARRLFAVDLTRAARVAVGGRRRGLFSRNEHLRLLSARDLREFLPDEAPGLARILPHLPPGRRAEAFDAVVDRRGGPFQGLQTFWLLPLLPPDLAAAEARRMLDWYGSVWHSARSQLDDPEIPLKLTAHLPYAEASGPLREAALTGDPRRRGLARDLLVRAASRTGDPAILRGVVRELAGRTRNERDPMRCALIESIASVPVALLDGALAGPLDGLAVAAVESRDSSPRTRRALRDLADRALSHAPDLRPWAFGVYDRLVARCGTEQLEDPGHYLDLVLPRGAEYDLLDVLRPRLRAARERRDPGLAIELAWSLGRRAFGLAELQDDVRAGALDRSGDRAADAAAAWLEDPARRTERAVELIAADPEAIGLPEVWRVVASRRTDLLDLPGLLDPPGGAHRRDRAPVVLPQDPGRWTPAQAGRVREALHGVAGDGGLPADARVAAVASLGRLPGALGDLTVWAGGDDAVLAEAAMEAMAGTDRPAEALGLLLGHARATGSPYAVAAAAGCCAAVPPSALGPVLAGTLTGPDARVTMRKQAARLLERLRPPGAADALLGAWRDPGLHRDVRAAVAAALRRIPGDPRAFAALEGAAGPYASEPLLRTLFQAQPQEYAPADRPRYAALVRLLLAAADGPGVRFRGSRAFQAWAWDYTGGFDDLLATVGDAADPAGDVDLRILGPLVAAEVVGAQTLDVLARLLPAAESGGPGRRRLLALVGAVGGSRAGTPPGERRAALLRRTIELLRDRPLLLPQVVELTFDLPPLADARTAAANELADALDALAGLLRDRPVVLAEVDWRVRTVVGRGYGQAAVSPPRLLPAARRLAGREHLVAHLLAVRIVGTAGGTAGWPDEWRALLDDLRRSPHADVRRKAIDTDPDA